MKSVAGTPPEGVAARAPDEARIRQAVAAALAAIAPGTDLQHLRADAPLRQQIDLDSMDWLNLALDLRDRLGIDIPEADYGRIATLEAMVAYLAARQAQSPGPRAGSADPLPREHHVVNGTPVTVRPIRPEDKPLEADFVRHLSSETRYRRFMLTLRELSPEKLRYLTEVDQDRHVALVATIDEDAREVEIGVARYIVDPRGGSCEFAIAVDDAWQGTGLAGVLMHALMEVARARGIARMEGVVLASNGPMLRFARQLGFALEHDPEDRTTVRVVRPL